MSESDNNDSNTTKYIFLSGDGSGAGKTSVAIGILNSLLQQGIDSSLLGYIKPCTQCEAIQLLWKYCYDNNIDFVSYDAPIIYYSGYTHDVIGNNIDQLPNKQHYTVESRRKLVYDAITELSNRNNRRKQYIVIDGVGYPAVGSCVGLSNADVAKLVNAPVICVGKSGVGNAIDSLNYVASYFRYNNVYVLGSIFNKVTQTSYHSIDDIIKYTKLYYAQQNKQNNTKFNIYGHIQLLTNVGNKSHHDKPPDSDDACRRKLTNKQELEYIDDEKEYIDRWLELFNKSVDIKLLKHDIDNYWLNLYNNNNQQVNGKSN